MFLIDMKFISRNLKMFYGDLHISRYRLQLSKFRISNFKTSKHEISNIQSLKFRSFKCIQNSSNSLKHESSKVQKTDDHRSTDLPKFSESQILRDEKYFQGRSPDFLVFCEPELVDFRSSKHYKKYCNMSGSQNIKKSRNAKSIYN